MKYHLPDAHTDFILAVVSEEFGMVVCVVLVALYAYLVWHGFTLLLKQEDRFTLLAGSGLLMLFALQVLVNMGVVLNVIPTTGMTLPFMSYGGSGTLSMALVIGFILAFTAKREKQKYGK